MFKGCQGIKLKLLTFAQNWEIRVVFTESRHIVGDKKIFFGYYLSKARKCHPGKELFKSMTLYNTHRNHHREMFFLCFSYTWLGYEIEINRQIDFGQIKVRSKQHELSKNNMARYISSQVKFQQQDLFYQPTFRFIRKAISSSRYLNNRSGLKLVKQNRFAKNSDVVFGFL